MIKMLKDLYERLLVLVEGGRLEGLEGGREVAPVDWNEIASLVYRKNHKIAMDDKESWHLHTIQQAALNVMRLSEGGSKQPSWDDLVHELTSLKPSEGPQDHAELIDAIVEILSWSFAQNKLDGDAIHALRKAVLTPEEVGAFKEKIKKEEMGCPCGHRFTIGEVVTYWRDPDSEKPLIMCSRCVGPQSRMCSEPDCHSQVTWTLPTGPKCKNHRGGKKVAEEPVVGPAVAGQPDNQLHDIMAQFRNVIIEDANQPAPGAWFDLNGPLNEVAQAAAPPRRVDWAARANRFRADGGGER